MGLMVAATTPKGIGYTHTQALPLQTWTVTHNLNLPGGVAVDVMVSIDSVMTKILPQDVSIVDENTITITFTKPYGGVARLV